MYRRLLYMLVSMLLLLVCTGCPGGGGEKKPVPKQGPKIGVSMADMERDGNQVIKKVFEKAAKEKKAQVTWLDAKGDPSQQQKDIQKLIEEKVKVVILQITDPAIAPDIVRLLQQNNIKVIALETLPVDTPVDGYITSDHSRTGQLQVKYLQTLLEEGSQQLQQGNVVLTPQKPQQAGQKQGQQGQQQGGQQGQQQGGQQGQQGQGGQQQQMIIPDQQQAAVSLQDGVPMKVVVLQGDNNDQMAREITASVNSALQKVENIDVILSQPHPRWDANLAKSTMQQVLSKTENVDAVLANGSNLAMAAVEVLKQSGMERRVITVGVGATPKAIKAMESGEHDAEVDNRPDMLGRLAFDASMDIAEGKVPQYDTRVNNGDYTVPTKIVPPRLVTQDNLYLLQERMKETKQQEEGQQQQQGQQQGGQQGQQDQQQQQGQNQQGQQQQQQQGQGQQGQQKTTLRITTEEGKVVEVQIDGNVQSIQSQAGGGQQQGQQQQQGGQQQQQGGQQQQ
ncbi:MAG: sugar ABC transporter substrate-binding protein [Firmicutes bacterium]|nr:sugar ABC transporter substrate-binding protein [Bacillota bacterium]